MKDTHHHIRNLYIALWVGAAIAFVLLQAHNAFFSVLLARGEGFFASIFPQVLVLLANDSREEEGAGSLAVNPLLQAAAEAKAADMAHKGYFAHTSPDGTPPWFWIRQEGYRFAAAGENLAVNFNDSGALHEAWMLSPSHRRNLINRRYTEIGIGTATGTWKGQEATFVVQYFARPAGQ